MSSQNSNFSEGSLNDEGKIHYCRTVDGLFDETFGYHSEQQGFLDELQRRIDREDSNPFEVYFIARLAKMLKQAAARERAKEKASN